MFIVLLRFTEHRAQAAMHTDGHNAWLRQGFDEGVFLLAGSLQPGLGGGILARGTTLAELRGRVERDPFVAAGVVAAEILELAPGKADPRLAFLAC